MFLLEKLTEKQERFIDYYIQTANATAAAILAGYSEKTARQIGSENLSKLNTHIKERAKPQEDKRIADGQEILRYLTDVMRGNVKDTFNFDASLKDRNKAAELLGKSQRLFVDKIEQKNTGDININFAISRPKKEK